MKVLSFSPRLERIRSKHNDGFSPIYSDSDTIRHSHTMKILFFGWIASFYRFESQLNRARNLILGWINPNHLGSRNGIFFFCLFRLVVFCIFRRQSVSIMFVRTPEAKKIRFNCSTLRMIRVNSMKRLIFYAKNLMPFERRVNVWQMAICVFHIHLDSCVWFVWLLFGHIFVAIFRNYWENCVSVFGHLHIVSPYQYSSILLLYSTYTYIL